MGPDDNIDSKKYKVIAKKNKTYLHQLGIQLPRDSAAIQHNARESNPVSLRLSPAEGRAEREVRRSW